MKKPFFTLLAMCLSIGLFESCQKDNPDDLSDVRHVQISNLYETVSNDIFKTFLYSVLAINDSLYHPNDTTNFRFNEPCLSLNLVPFDTVTWPKTLHITFSSGGCTGYDGVSREGDITVEMPAADLTPNLKFTVSFNNFLIGTIPVSGYKNIYLTTNSGTSFMDTTFLQINTTTPSTEWTSRHYLQWALGKSTHQDISDDLFLYNGNASCMPLTENDPDEISFDVNIVEALQFINYCYWIGSGKAEIIPSGRSVRTVTYLDSCINQAIIVVNNESQYVSF